MSDLPFPERSEIRSRVLDALVLFRHADRLAAVRPAMTGEQIAFELCRLWFDRIYTPGIRYMDGLKGDSDPEARARFEEAFSDEEFAWLERFNRFLELRVDRLTLAQKSKEIFPDNDTWRGIMRDAGNLLDLMDVDPDRKRRRFERVMKELKP